jgi:hypothetical protein
MRQGAKGAQQMQRAPSTGEANGKAEKGGAAANLSVDERSRITTVIKQGNVQPENNVNFSVSVGTRVPREVHLYPMPREIVDIRPAWRRYEFILIGDEVVVVNPRTFEIVAVMPA